MTARDREDCKMFVGGLTKDTTADMLKSYFSHFGHIVHAIVMTNPETQKSRGFGFVAFDRPDIVDRVLLSGPHYLDGKQIDPKPSVPKDLRPRPPQVEQPKKAFLGGLPLEMNEADLREYFSRYGVVTECYIMFDEKKMKSRGFGFVSFEDETIVDELVRQHHIDVRDKKVEVKLARPRENPLAPLNSEGRVLSVDAQQQRMVATAASAPRRPRPPEPYYSFRNNYPPYDYPPADTYYGGGPPASKRPRTGAHTPPIHSPSWPTNYPAGGYDDRPPSYGPGGHGMKGPSAMPPASNASFPISFPNLGGSTSDTNAMTPESMMTMMQQTMQNMGGSMGMNMNMMMPMLMSNVMTQMFMNQAQTLFQSFAQQKKTTEQPSIAGTSKSEGQSSTNSKDMMEAMKNALQSMMSNMQHKQDDHSQ